MHGNPDGTTQRQHRTIIRGECAAIFQLFQPSTWIVSAVNDSHHGINVITREKSPKLRVESTRLPQQASLRTTYLLFIPQLECCVELNRSWSCRACEQNAVGHLDEIPSVVGLQRVGMPNVATALTHEKQTNHFASPRSSPTSP
jgi:hypothetical protein